MVQMVLKNKLLLAGKPHEITDHLKELSTKYHTLKELISDYVRPMQKQ